MRKVFFALIACVSFWSCSTSPNNNGGTNTTIIPIAPSNLTGVVVSNTRVNLSWTDNSTNETGFKIERRLDGGNYAVIGTVNTDILNYSDSGLIAYTNYTYRVYSYNAVGNSITYSNEFSISTGGVPVLSTNTISAITFNTAVSGGNITNDGGTSVIVRGVVWSTSSNPTINLSTKTTDGNGSGAFNSNIVGLNSNTTYYVRAYATNSLGTAYGNEQTFITSTLVNLPSIAICNQFWTTQNLNVGRYRNGDLIPEITDAAQWSSLTTGAWCWYNNDSINYGSVYGKLYNWYAVNDPRGLAPSGWHVPSDYEWKKLVKCIDPNADTLGYIESATAGGAMKEVGVIHWLSPNFGATNNSGFMGLPGGLRFRGGYFDYVGNIGLWWTSTPSNEIYYARTRCLSYSSAEASHASYCCDSTKNAGLTIRLVRD